MIAFSLRKRDFTCFGYLRSVLHMADLMFGGFTRITVSWQTIAIGFALLSIVCFVIVMRRIRSVDLAS